MQQYKYTQKCLINYPLMRLTLGFIFLYLIAIFNVYATSKQTIQYKIKASFITVAHMTIEYNISDQIKPFYQLNVEGETAGFASLADYKIKAYAIGTFYKRLTPKSAQLTYQSEGSWHDIKIDYLKLKPKITMNPVQKIKKTDAVVNPDDFINALDPLSLLSNIIIKLKKNNNCKATYRVVDGRSVFTSTLVDLGRSEIKSDSFKGETYLCLVMTKARSGPSITGRAVPDVSIHFGNLPSFPYPLPIKISGTLFHFNIEVSAENIY